MPHAGEYHHVSQIGIAVVLRKKIRHFSRNRTQINCRPIGYKSTQISHINGPVFIVISNIRTIKYDTVAGGSAGLVPYKVLGNQADIICFKPVQTQIWQSE